MLQQVMDANGFPNTSIEERLYVRMWCRANPHPREYLASFKYAAESFHALSLTTDNPVMKSDLITLRNIATYRAANP